MKKTLLRFFAVVLVIGFLLVQMQTGLLTGYASGGGLGAWQSAAAMQYPHSYFGAAVSDQYIYVIGDQSEGVEYTTVGSNGNLGSWQDLPPLPGDLSAQVAVASGGTVYAISGSGAVVYADILSSGQLDDWQTGPTLIHSRYGFAAFAAHGYLYVVGGNDGLGVLQLDCERARIKTDGGLEDWEVTSPLPAGRRGFAFAMQEDNVYLMGGGTEDSYTRGVYRGAVVANGSITWTNTTALPETRIYGTATAAGGFVYVLGGWNPSATSAPLKTVRYAAILADGSLSAWSSTTSLVTGREGLQAVVANGYIFALGGYNALTNYSYKTVEKARLSGGSAPTATPGPRLVRVLDDDDQPVAKAEVYHRGSLIGLTDGAGEIKIKDMNQLDTLAARIRITEVPTQRLDHSTGNEKDWTYRVYFTSVGLDPSGSARIYNADLSKPVQILKISKDNVLVGFNIVVSLEWDAYGSELSNIAKKWQQAAHYLYTVTNGQMLLERVTLYDASQKWDSTDYRVLADNSLRAGTDSIAVGGTTGDEGYVDLSSNDGYRTFIHEFGHYGLGLYDSYVRAEPDGKGKVKYYEDGNCTDKKKETGQDERKATLMDEQAFSKQFALRTIPELWSDLCETSKQMYLNKASDWETIAKNFQGSDPVDWAVKTPADRMPAGMVPGPSGIPVKDWLVLPETINGGGQVCQPNPVVTIYSNLEQPAPKTKVWLKRTDGQVIYQGLSGSYDSKITILGASNGDRLVMNWDGVELGEYNADTISCVSGSPAPAGVEDGQIITLAPPPVSLAVSVAPGMDVSQGEVTISASQALDAPPVVMVYQDHQAAGIAVPVTAVGGNSYTGSFLLDPSMPLTGTVEVSAASGGQPVTTYSAFTLNAYTLGQEIEIFSSDGLVHAYLQGDSLSGNGTVSITPETAVPPAPQGLLRASQAYRLQVGGGASINQPVQVFISIPENDSELYKRGSIKPYFWDGSGWVEISGSYQTERKVMRIEILSGGMYGLFGEPPAAFFLPVVVR